MSAVTSSAHNFAVTYRVMRPYCLVAFVAIVLGTLHAQTTCPQPPVLDSVSSQDNMFSDQQEADLGDAMDERFSQEFPPIQDAALTAHIRELGDRLISHLPPTQFRFQFLLIDLPEVNAMSSAGGRVYLTRKLIAFAKSDDEIAGVIAHELGHIVTHEIAIEMSAAFRGVGITQVGDRKDIFEKFHQYLDSRARNPRKPTHHAEEHQYIADQVAVFAMARAGFAPYNYVALWDRFGETHGKTGNWFTDMFGTTRPEQRRLRELVHDVAALPPQCTAILSPAGDAFQRWQTDVISYRRSSDEENLPGLIRKVSLASPLRPDLVDLQFSPDGKYILAQDEGGIHVLSREPFAYLFFIEAPGTVHRSFSPDSKYIVFSTASLRVEAWDLASRKQVVAKELVVRDDCLRTAISPDGKTLACVNYSALTLLDVASGDVIATRKGFFQRPQGFVTFATSFARWLAGPNRINMHFSPDGHYFLAGTFGADFCIDLLQRQLVNLPGPIRHLTYSSFAFLGPDRIVGIDFDTPGKSPILRFPSGDKLAEMPLLQGMWLGSVTHGDHFFVAPLRYYSMGIFDISKRDVVIGFTNYAADAYDDVLVQETGVGQVALTEISTKRTLSTIPLQQSRLGYLRAAAISGDLNYLALSTKSRGGLWDLAHNVQISQPRAFQGAWFSGDDTLFADFPNPQEENNGRNGIVAEKKADSPRTLARFDPQGNASTLMNIKEEELALQAGPYLVLTKWTNPKSWVAKNATLELYDYRNKITAWSQHFPDEIPQITLDYAAGTLFLVWSVSDPAKPIGLQDSPDLRRRAEKYDYILELLDFRKNAVLGRLLVKTNGGSFGVQEAQSDGDAVIVAAGSRVLSYSLSTGEQKGHFVGSPLRISPAGGLFGVITNSNAIDLYDFSTSQLRHHYQFPVAPAVTKFSLDGKRLFVLTRDQTAYLLDLTVTQN